MAANEDSESKHDLSGMQAQAETIKTGDCNRRGRFISRDGGCQSIRRDTGELTAIVRTACWPEQHRY